MHLQRLQLTDFRNFSKLQVTLSPRLNFFVGENGQGKTNFLEAVFLLSRGVTFRAADSRNLIRRNPIRANEPPGDHPSSENPRAKIAGHFTRDGIDDSVEMIIESGHKTVMMNGKRVNAATLLRCFPTILFSPESLAAIKEGPDQRRQLIDELLMSHDPRQAQLLRDYSRALRARNRLLKNLAHDLGNRLETERSLESLDKIFFLLATHLTTARIRAFNDIEADFRRAMNFIMSDADGDISVDYLISDQSAWAWNETQIFDALQKRHQSLRFREMAAGSSLVGPHKHDIKFIFNGNDSRFYCSQGQQRALILALKIAQIVYHHRVHQTYPVLLLDDVLSELDAKKRVTLLEFLEGISAQILITATDLTWSHQIGFDRNSIFAVANGRVEPKDKERADQHCLR